MKRSQAWAKARQLWATPGITPDDRVAFVVTRRKNVVDRFEVGYYTRGGRLPSGVLVSFDYVVMGRGPSWEAAFADADRRSK